MYGYACFYQSNTNRGREIEPTEITITFVCNHYPREMMKHLKEGRGIRAECHYKGVYYLKGDAIPMQLLITHELTQEENCWIQSLRMNLRAGKELSGLITRYEPFKDSKDHAAVMDLITRANWKEMEVEEKMCDALRELFADEMEKEREKARRTGRQEGLEQGLEEGLALAKLIFRLSSEGRSEEEIAGITGAALPGKHVSKPLDLQDGDAAVVQLYDDIRDDQITFAGNPRRVIGKDGSDPDRLMEKKREKIFHSLRGILRIEDFFDKAVCQDADPLFAGTERKKMVLLFRRPAVIYG